MNVLPSFGPSAIVLVLYLLATLLVGWAVRRRSASASDYLNATSALPLPIVVAAYLAANCGALEIVGLSAMAAQYGAQAFHFYWIGAIPAMVFLALFMMPVYRRNGISSVPEYLQVRYGQRMRLLNAGVTAIILLLLAGISLYAMSQVIGVILGVNFFWSTLLCDAVVTAYVLAGGIRATVYNELLQLGVMIAGLAPLAVRSARIPHALTAGVLGAKGHVWKGLSPIAPGDRLDIAGVLFGLGFILSFSYWCTDFVQMQRAFAARTEFEARQVPLWAGFGKLLFAPVVVLPGLAAVSVLPALGGRYDTTLPQMMKLLYGPWMLGLGITALAASLMSGLASNLSGFAAVCLGDLFPALLKRRGEDASGLLLSRLVVLLAAAVSMGLSYLNFFFSNLMEHVQLIFSVCGAPFWAIFALGLLTRTVKQRAAFAGFVTGAALALLHSLAVMSGWLHYGSTMAGNFYGASLGFVSAGTAALVYSRFMVRSAGESPSGSSLLHWRVSTALPRQNAYLWLLAAMLLACTVACNILWW